MPVAKLDYPQILTKAAWNKNKGTAAKIFVGKTDVGASLAAVETLFKEKGFADIKPYAGLDPIEAEAHKNKIVMDLTEGAKLIAQALVAVDGKARDAKSAFAKSKTTSEAAKTYVNNLTKAIVPFTNEVNGYPAKVGASLMVTYRENLKANGNYKALQAYAAGVDKTLSDIKTRVNIVIKSPTVAELSKQFRDTEHGNRIARDLTTLISYWSKTLLGMFPLFAPSHYAGNPNTKLQKLTRLWQLGNESNGEASKAVKELIKPNVTEASVVKGYCNGFLQELEDGDLKTYLDALKSLAHELAR